MSYSVCEPTALNGVSKELFWGFVSPSVNIEFFASPDIELANAMKRRKSPIPQQKRPVVTVSKQQILANAANLDAALAMHRQGQLDQAETLYKAILQSQPQHFDALQLLATIAAQRKDSATAVKLFDQALKINPNHANSLNNRGNALRDLKRPEQALESYDRALTISPDYVDALYNRGIALRDLKRLEQALESYNRALAIKPDYADALTNRGNALLELKHPEQALENYDLALTIKPDYAEALNSRGNALRDLKCPEQALESYDKALAIKPDYADALTNRGIALFELECPEQALESYDRALTIKPDYAEALTNRGNALRELNRPEQALESYDRALTIKPGYAEALTNRGNTLLELKRPEQALKSYDRALTIKPDYAEAHWNESLCRLLMGDFTLGWQKYEWRWKMEFLKSNVRNFKQPLWLGKEELKNKTILLYSEQGLGDTLQFCRYVGQVAELGAKVILEVPLPLKALLKNLAGVTTILSTGENLPDFDYHCPLLSLPLAFKTDMGTITNSSYLKCDQHKIEEWEPRLDKSNKKRIGLVWSGNQSHKNDRNRSIALDEFKGFVDDRADLYCLQKELRSENKAILEHTHNIKFFGDQLKDFTDTAALVELMDLVITVDTSVAHLAGAMGKEVWILLPFNPDWRWLLDRSDSPWYQSAKLFRQPSIGDWNSVILDVKTALIDF